MAKAAAKSKSKGKSATSAKGSAKSKSGKSAKAASAKPKGAAGSAPKTGGASEASQLLSRLPPLSDVQRSAFEASYSEASCAKLGAQTQSELVRRDALAFAHAIAETFKKDRASVRKYTDARFAWFLETIVRLEQARAASASDKQGSRAAAGSVESATREALDAREELLTALTVVVGDDPVERAALAEATGHSTPARALSESVQALAKLGDRWLRKTDGESRALVASVDLSRGDVDRAWAAAAALDHAADVAAGRAPRTTRDSEGVNVAEGRVLNEMRVAMQLFEQARTKSRAVPNLVPGAGTRRVLGSHTKKAAAPGPTNGTTGSASATPS